MKVHHCKVVLTQLDYLSFLSLVCIAKHMDSKQVKNLIWLSKSLVIVMEEYFPNEIVQSRGKEY